VVVSLSLAAAHLLGGNHYLRSLEDYDHKVKTHRTNTDRYQDALKLFWDRETAVEIHTELLPYVCPVRAHLQVLRDQLEGGGKNVTIYPKALRPVAPARPAEGLPLLVPLPPGEQAREER
jgi:hypothetical protein